MSGPPSSSTPSPPPAVTQAGAGSARPAPGKLKAWRRRPVQGVGRAAAGATGAVGADIGASREVRTAAAGAGTSREVRTAAAGTGVSRQGRTAAGGSGVQGAASASGLSSRRPGRARPAVGNAATAALAVRGAGPSAEQGTGGGGRAVGAKATASPGLRRIAAHVAAGKRALVRHPAPDAEAAAAQRAAVAPAGERAAFAGQDQAAAIASAEAKPFARAEFVAKFEQRIMAEQPETEAKAKELADPSRPDTLTPQLSGEARTAADTSAGELRATAAAPPDAARVPECPPVPLTPDRPPPVPAPPAASDAVPPPLPAKALDVSANARGTTTELSRAGLTDETLSRANEPAFSTALQAKRTAERDSAAAPAALRAKEAEQRAAAERSATVLGGAAMKAMAGARAAAGTSVTGGKQTAQARTEARRAEITARLTGIYEDTKQAVEALLKGLDDTVRTLFEGRAVPARTRFLAACEKTWLNWFTGGPDYKAHAAVYTAEIRGAVDAVADVVEKRINEARQKAADGRRSMAAYVAGLEKGMREFGERTAAGFAERFDALEASVDEKADGLVEVLADCYTQAQEATDAALAEVKEANKGLWERARDAVVGAVKVLLDLKNLLLGVVKRAAGVADRIVTNPIGFLRNLGASVKAGLMGFLANIGTHFKAALKDWLFGSLAQAGVELPEQWDLRGVVKLVLSLLGISWAFIRAELLKHMPESVLHTVSGAVKVIGIVRDKGVGGLWEEIRDKVGDLKQQAFDMLRQFVVDTVLKAGVNWLLSLITPAGALVKAVMAVYDFLTFLVEKARALAEFVNGILDTLEEICNGVSQKVATKIETSLARTLPLAIDLLARVLKLGAIPAKIKAVLEKIGTPVRGFVSKMIAKAAAFGKKLLAGGRRAFGKLVGKADRRTRQEKQRDLSKGVGAAVDAVNALKESDLGAKAIGPVLAAIQLRYRMASLKAAPEDGTWYVEGVVNPEKRAKTRRKVSFELDIETNRTGAMSARLTATWFSLNPPKDLTAKIEALEDASRRGKLITTKPERNPSKTQSFRRKLEEKYKDNKTELRKLEKQDVDHPVELQLGGKDDIRVMTMLDRRVNRVFGSRIHHAIKHLALGTKIKMIFKRRRK
ncbi:hypothetical protein ACWD25_40135 [Streptomyces sp. NPDC002920]